MTGILRLVMIAFDLLAVALIVLAASAWRKRNHMSSVIGFLAAALFLTLGVLCGAIALGIHGYRAFTQEEVAATIKTEPVGPHRFRATVTLPDSSLHMFDLAGDRKSTRLNSSHGYISYAVFCLKKKKKKSTKRQSRRSEDT